MRRWAHDGGAGRLPLDQSRQLGVPGAAPRGERRVRPRRVPVRPEAAVRCGAVRCAAPRRHRRTRRRAPPVPHRHRHPVARTPRRHRDRTRLQRVGDRGRPRSRGHGRPAGRLRGVRRVRRAGGVGGGAIRSRLHRDRRTVLAAECRALGRRRGTAAPAGRRTVHPGGAPGAVGDGRSPTRPPRGAGVPVLRDRRRAVLRRVDLCRSRGSVGRPRHRPLQPRSRRDLQRAVVERARDHPVRGARFGAVARPRRPDGRGARARGG